MATEPTNLRLDIQAKQQAYAIFEQVGLKPAQAVNLFLQQVVLHQGLPFDVKVPNKDSQAALDELEKAASQSFQNTDALYKDLGI